MNAIGKAVGWPVAVGLVLAVIPLVAASFVFDTVCGALDAIVSRLVDWLDRLSRELNR